jgi:hypothetical protein
MQLSVLQQSLGICLLPATAPIPDWALGGSFCSITRTETELTIVCREDAIPSDSECVRNWRCLRVDGRFDLDETGVIASLSEPLAEAGISIYVVSSYDTDYLLVQGEMLKRAVSVLCDRGHVVVGSAVEQAGNSPRRPS